MIEFIKKHFGHIVGFLAWVIISAEVANNSGASIAFVLSTVVLITSGVGFAAIGNEIYRMFKNAD